MCHSFQYVVEDTQRHMHAQTHAHTHVQKHMHKHTRKYTHKYTHTGTHTYTHTCTHTHAHTVSKMIFLGGGGRNRIIFSTFSCGEGRIMHPDFP